MFIAILSMLSGVCSRSPQREWVLALWGLLLLGGALPAAAQVDDVPTTSKSVRLRSSDGGPQPILRSIAPSSQEFVSPRWEAVQARLRLRHESEELVRRRMGPHPMSQKGLARRDARVRRMLKSGGLAEPETLKVLLLRISFREDRSGELTSVTTDGNFRLEPLPADSVTFDPPPHNRAYFQAHLDGLAEYWGSMSNGLIYVESKVLPEGPDQSYQLDDIADYGPGRGGFWTIEALERLVVDMITEADAGTIADGSANLADFDYDDPNTFLIFAHAGADLQSNLVFTEGQEGYSPNDIPTFFVSLGGDARVTLQSVDSDTGEPGLITECSVIPETTNQDGLLGSIAAALMHEFGHALGLPDLYSTYTGLPTIGYWGIMDSGTNLAAAVGIDLTGNGVADRVDIVTGLLPPQASAWSRWYLGFTEEIRVGSTPVQASLPASYRQDTREKVLRLDVSPDEFFLVENRWIPPIGLPEWGLFADPQTRVIQFLGEFDQGGSLIGNTHLYDFFMPFAGGLQVWRIRQDRVEAGLYNNTVQAFPNRLGVELIEADGIQDIGVFDFTTVGFIGSDTDSFRDLSEFSYVVDESTTIRTTYSATTTELTTNGMPSSQSTFKIPTGVRLSGIGPTNESATSVRAWVEGLVVTGDEDAAGMPIDLPDSPNDQAIDTIVRGFALSPVAVDLSGGPTLLVAAEVADTTSAPSVFAYGFDGEPRFANPRVASLSGRPFSAPVVIDEAVLRIAFLSDNGDLDVLAESGGTLVVEASDHRETAFDDGPLVISVAGAPWIIGANRNEGRVEAWTLNATSVLNVVGPSAEGDSLLSNLVALHIDPIADTLVGIVSGGVWEWTPGTRSARILPIGLELAGPGHLVAWPDAEGDDRLSFVDPGGRVYRLDRADDGSWSANGFGRDLGGALVGELAVADLDGDGRNDLIALTRDRIWARHGSGVDLYGFPKLLSDHFIVAEDSTDLVVSAPLVADLNRSGSNEILFVTSLGLVHAVNARGESVSGFPRRLSGGGATAPMVVDQDLGNGSQRALVLFDALGDTLGSGRRTRSARINAADLGASPAGAPADRPSEWAVRGGNLSRTGRGGVGGAATISPVPARALQPTIYPNPMNDGITEATIRFTSGAVHTCTVTMYNLEGQEVMSQSEQVNDIGPVSVAVDTSGWTSGAYLCRLDYTAESGATTDLMTFYVER